MSVTNSRILEPWVLYKLADDLTPLEMSRLKVNKSYAVRIDDFFAQQIGLIINSDCLSALAAGVLKGEEATKIGQEWLVSLKYPPMTASKLLPFVVITDRGFVLPKSRTQAFLQISQIAGNWLRISGLGKPNCNAQTFLKAVEEGQIRSVDSFVRFNNAIVDLFNPPRPEASSAESPSITEPESEPKTKLTFAQTIAEARMAYETRAPQERLGLANIGLASLPAEILSFNPKTIDLSNNQIKDITLLGAFENLEEVILSGNPLPSSSGALESMQHKRNPLARDKAKIVFEAVPKSNAASTPLRDLPYELERLQNFYWYIDHVDSWFGKSVQPEDKKLIEIWNKKEIIKKNLDNEISLIYCLFKNYTNENNFLNLTKLHNLIFEYIDLYMALAAALNEKREQTKKVSSSSTTTESTSATAHLSGSSSSTDPIQSLDSQEGELTGSSSNFVSGNPSVLSSAPSPDSTLSSASLSLDSRSTLSPSSPAASPRATLSAPSMSIPSSSSSLTTSSSSSLISSAPSWTSNSSRQSEKKRDE